MRTTPYDRIIYRPEAWSRCMRTVIRDAYIVTQNTRREIVKGDILVEGGRIAQIGEVRDSADREIDASGDIIIPGLINDVDLEGANR